MKKFSFILLVSLLGLFNTNVMANNSGQYLQSYVNQLQTFEADFVQTQPDEALFTTNTSIGHFKLSRPGKINWRYHEPEEQSIVVDGLNLWFYDMDLEQVTVRPIDDVRADLPISWLLYREPIENRFTILEFKDENGTRWFNLKPKQATYFESIEVGMRNGEMTEVWMYQGPENITKVKFNNVTSNEELSSLHFNFKVPERVDLVGTPL